MSCEPDPYEIAASLSDIERQVLIGSIIFPLDERLDQPVIQGFKSLEKQRLIENARSFLPTITPLGHKVSQILREFRAVHSALEQANARTSRP